MTLLSSYDFLGDAMTNLLTDMPKADILPNIKHILQAEKAHLRHRYGVTEIGVFGSYVRQEQRPDSDLDVLVGLTEPPQISLLGLVNLQNYLSDLLGVSVQVTLKKNLRPELADVILAEVEMV
jgi:predicted nucleotidyltransferase